MHAAVPHAGTDRGGHVPHQVGVEGRAPGKRAGKIVADQAAKPVRHSS
jgi:hypothetical protein